jgi:hypothetical protein
MGDDPSLNHRRCGEDPSPCLAPMITRPLIGGWQQPTPQIATQENNLLSVVYV